MKCSFCNAPVSRKTMLQVNALCLCPHCLNQLLSVSPDDKAYPWFVSAVRRTFSA